MKRLTAALLAIALILTACTAPAGSSGGGPAPSESTDGGSGAPSESTDGGSGAAYEGRTGEQSRTESGEGFVTAQESREDSAAGQEEDSAANSTDADDGPQNGLVIIEEREGNYRSAADRKKTKEEDTAHSALMAAGENGEDGPKVSQKKEYTVMVYIVGSNLESRYGSATNDIAEMKQAGLDYEKTNLLVYTGGSKRWVSDIPSTSNNVLDLSKDREESSERIVAHTEKSANMGIPQTLAAFVDYCTENYPADHYGLILWNHGGGPLWGYGSDELFKNDSLLLEELRSAMDRTAFGPGRNAQEQSGQDQNSPDRLRLDWVGFDACLMGGLESARLWKNYADYLVGSEELEPGRGWDYTFLRVLNETSDPGRIVSSIVDSYGGYYEQNRSQFFNPDVTLSALDLSKTDEVVSAADGLFAAMRADIGKGKYALLNQARGRAKAFGLSASDSKAEAYDLIDLKDLAAKTGSMYPEESGALEKAVDAMVIGSVSNVEGTGGVSIYLPGDNRDLYEVAKELYTKEEILSDEYGQFVDAYTGEWFAGIDADWTLADLQRGSKEWTLQLTPEQAKYASECAYTVLFRNGWGDYQIATCNIRVYADENNTLHVPQDPLLLTAETDLQESARPWACYQVSDSDGESVYKTAGTILSSGHEFSGFDRSVDEEVSISVKNVTGERETTIQDVLSDSGGVSLSGKGSVDVSGYRSIVDAGGDTICPVRDGSGQMKPYSEWEYKGYLFYQLAIDDSFRFFMKPSSEFDVDCICQVTVKDVNGNLHGTEFVELDPDREGERAETETDEGTLYFDIKEDHAELTGYEGQDTSLTVPDSVSGKPVTVVGKSAFAGKGTLETVTLPDSVTQIGKSAFYNTAGLRQIDLPAQLETIGMAAFRESGVEQIQLPEGLEKIGRGAFIYSGLGAVEIPDSVQEIGGASFAGCKALTEITVSGNPNYKSVDGVLYTKDGRRLVQYPAGKGAGEYTVEDGAEEIGYGAFAMAGLEKVNFPETLLVIDNDAFFECYALTQLQLPDSLQRIGSMAFGRDREEEEPAKGQAHPGSVRIGPEVSAIGTDAFTALEIEAFEVDDDNAVYASSGGFITNKAGDTVQTVPTGTGGRIVIPEGITTLQSGLFTTFDEYTDFYVPDSVFRFSENVFPKGKETSKETGKLEEVYHCTLHCSEGSAAWEYAEKYGIAHDSNIDPESENYETAEEDGEHGKFCYRVFRDHAELYAYEEGKGDETGTLEIPSSYQDLPVTALRFDEDAKEKKLNYSIGVAKIAIPESVKEIDIDFLRGHAFLSEIEVSPDNAAFGSTEGVLFTADGKKLICYPVRREGAEYVIPPGVETLGEKAFALNGEIEKVTMPRSIRSIEKECFVTCRNLKEAEFNRGLREIGDQAFMYTSLENVQLPDSVEWIGSGAFLLNDNFGEIVLPEKLRKMGYAAFEADFGKTFTQEVIRIPANLEIGMCFLERVLFERYEVDPDSSFYKEEDGILMSRDGTQLVSVPTLREGELFVPEGTLAVNYYALNGCDLITDIYLSDSLLDIGNIGVTDKETGDFKYVIHCRENSEASKKLDAKKVPWTAIGD